MQPMVEVDVVALQGGEDAVQHGRQARADPTVVAEAELAADDRRSQAAFAGVMPISA